MNTGPDRRCELCCGWGHIESKCGSKPLYSYFSGHYWTSYHKCNLVGCRAKQESLCGHTLEKCPNCGGNHIKFSSRCVKKTEGANATRHVRKMGLAGRAPTRERMNIATRINRVALGPSPRGVVADGGCAEGEMADVEEVEAMAAATDTTQAETAIETVLTTATETEPETEVGALPTNEGSDPAPLGKVIRVGDRARA